MPDFESVLDHFNFGVECLIAGDFNIDLLKYDAHSGTVLFLDCQHEHVLVPLITKPTHFTSDSFTLSATYLPISQTTLCCQVS